MISRGRTSRKYLYIFIFLMLSLIPLLDLFYSGLFVGHDTQDHVARIANFYQNLTDGNFIPRWAPNLNWGYGHPILMFLYPLPSYFASFFHFLGFSLVDSTKMVFGLGFALSGVTMYLWVRELWGEKAGLPAEEAGFVSGLLYMFAPYRFVDLYVRGAIGENFFFVWPPFVLYFLTKLSKELKWKYVVGGSLSLAAMLLSHNALSLMFLPFIFLYGLLLILQSSSKFLITSYQFLITIFGFGLSAFFWIPAFFEGQYTLRDIVTGDEIFNRFETVQRLIYSPWDYGGTGQFSVQLGVVQWVMILFAPIIVYYIWRKKLKDQRSKFKTTTQKLKLFLNLEVLLLTCSFVFFWASIFLILPNSKFIYEKLTILQKFQFPWRWLSFAIFPPAIITSVLVYLVPKKYKVFLIFSFSFLVLFLNKNNWHAKDYSNKPDSYYSGIYRGTTDTGESAPIWSVRFMLKEPKAHMEVIEGKAEIRELARKSTEHRYRLNIKSDKARLVENTLYFPGWRIYANGQQIVDLQFQDPAYRGLMMFWLDKGRHEIIVKFGETKLRLVADIISLASLFLLLSIPLIQRYISLYHNWASSWEEMA